MVSMGMRMGRTTKLCGDLWIRERGVEAQKDIVGVYDADKHGKEALTLLKGKNKWLILFSAKVASSVPRFDWGGCVVQQEVFLS